MTNILISPQTCRAARGLVHISQADLAKSANVSKQTLVDFERGARMPHSNNLLAIQAALEEQGVVFLEPNEEYGPGVRLSIRI